MSVLYRGWHDAVRTQIREALEQEPHPDPRLIAGRSMHHVTLRDAEELMFAGLEAFARSELEWWGATAAGVDDEPAS